MHRRAALSKIGQFVLHEELILLKWFLDNDDAIIIKSDGSDT